MRGQGVIWSPLIRCKGSQHFLWVAHLCAWFVISMHGYVSDLKQFFMWTLFSSIAQLNTLLHNPKLYFSNIHFHLNTVQYYPKLYFGNIADWHCCKTWNGETLLKLPDAMEERSFLITERSWGGRRDKVENEPWIQWDLWRQSCYMIASIR